MRREFAAVARARGRGREGDRVSEGGPSARPPASLLRSLFMAKYPASHKAFARLVRLLLLTVVPCPRVRYATVCE